MKLDNVLLVRSFQMIRHVHMENDNIHPIPGGLHVERNQTELYINAKIEKMLCSVQESML